MMLEKPTWVSRHLSCELLHLGNAFRGPYAESNQGALNGLLQAQRNSGYAKRQLAVLATRRGQGT